MFTQVWEGKEGIMSILDVRCRSLVEMNAYWKSGNGERTVCLSWVLSPNCLIVEIKDLFNSRKRRGHDDHA